MSSSQPEMPAVVEPAPITRDGLRAVSDPAKHEAFLRQVVRSTLVDYQDPNMSDPDFFEVALQTAFSRLKHSVTNVSLHDQVESSGRELNPKWTEKGAALVAYVQLELRYEFFRALCLDAFEEYKKSRK
jgi:predicted aminopeptidase